MVSWPPDLIYLALAIGGFLENVAPIVPSDVIAALGGFLSHQTTINPVWVWLIVWITNSSGGVIVYWTVRNRGERWLYTRVGTKLLSPEMMALLEREYLRFGSIGLFLARLLPGFRAFVAPFGGLIQIAPARVIIPIVLASGIWYGAVTWVATIIGGEWSSILLILGQVNTLLMVIAVGVGGVIAVSLLRRYRRARSDRLWYAIDLAFSHDDESAERVRNDPKLAVVAGLLIAIAESDDEISGPELDQIVNTLRQQWQLERPTAPPDSSTPIDHYGKMASRRWSQAARLRLLEKLKDMALTDRQLQEHEARLLARASLLLGLSAADLNARDSGEG